MNQCHAIRFDLRLELGAYPTQNWRVPQCNLSTSWQRSKALLKTKAIHTQKQPTSSWNSFPLRWPSVFVARLSARSRGTAGRTVLARGLPSLPHFFTSHIVSLISIGGWGLRLNSEAANLAGAAARLPARRTYSYWSETLRRGLCTKKGVDKMLVRSALHVLQNQRVAENKGHLKVT